MKPIDPQRLFEAADAILEATARAGDAGVIMTPDHDPADGETLPPGVFTKGELIEALQLLMRLGLTEGLPIEDDGA